MSDPAAIVRGNGPRDGFPDYIVKSLRRDKLGVFAGLVLRHFKVGAKNQRIDPAWLLPANAPQPWPLPCVDAQAELADAMCIVAYRYEGGDAPEEEAVTYELDTSMAEKPIQTHPSFASLKTKYLWDDAERQFAEFLPSGGGGPRPGDPGSGDVNIFSNESGVTGPIDRSTALSRGSGGSKTKTSPLFGVETWFGVSAVFRKSYAVPAGRVPASLLRGIGTIVAAPQGVGAFRLPSGSSNRNWLKMAPKLQKRGNLVQIAEETALSNPGGWKSAIYSFGQLQEEPGEDSGAT